MTALHAAAPQLLQCYRQLQASVTGCHLHYATTQLFKPSYLVRFIHARAALGCKQVPTKLCDQLSLQPTVGAD